jgi:hypothetical protein
MRPPDRAAATLQLRRSGLHWRRTENEVIVLDDVTGRYFALNRSGTALWELLRDGTTLARLAERLMSVYQLDGDRAARDVKQLVSELSERGLVQTEPTPEA